jgi:phospholipase C
MRLRATGAWGRFVKAIWITALAATIGAPVAIRAGHDRDNRNDWEHRDGDRDDESPIRHVVVIFQENVSFDHYFANYPTAANSDGSHFVAKPGTPLVNGLFARGLLDHNPNSTQPFRLGAAQAVTCDQGHGYQQEQQSYNAGAMNRFPETVGVGGPPCTDFGKGKGLVMGYYDGNTVTAFWNYAQHFAMNDNSYSTTFGPSTPGALMSGLSLLLPSIVTGPRLLKLAMVLLVALKAPTV